MTERPYYRLSAGPHYATPTHGEVVTEPQVEPRRETSTSTPDVTTLPHDHGCPVEQIHRIWTTDQGVDAWVLAEETLRFVRKWENRRCTCVGRPPKRPKGVPLTSVYDPDSGLWRPPHHIRCRCRYIEDYGFDRTACRADVHSGGAS